jgi:large subunit ribosomal protein L6
MSRIGKKPIELPAGVEFKAEGRTVRIKGPKGELRLTYRRRIAVEQEGKNLVVKCLATADDRQARALHGTTRSLLSNMVTGVSAGFSRKLEIEGVGYQAKVDKGELVLTMGFSHPVHVKMPPLVQVECPTPTQILLTSIDKHAIGDIAARIRKVRPPEPYKGKGIRYEGEHIKRKAGKAFGAA